MDDEEEQQGETPLEPAVADAVYSFNTETVQMPVQGFSF
jgi:hypothetical protein